VAIVDFLDTLYLYKAQLELAGEDTSFLNDVKVIKVGGRLNVGQVIERLRVKDEPIILAQEYTKILNSLVKEGEVAVVLVLGIEKFAPILELEKVLTGINALLSFVGDERRIMFYFINTDVLERAIPEVLPLLEDIGTTVVRINVVEKSYTFSVVKTINRKILGLKVTYS